MIKWTVKETSPLTSKDNSNNKNKVIANNEHKALEEKSHSNKRRSKKDDFVFLEEIEPVDLSVNGLVQISKLKKKRIDTEKTTALVPMKMDKNLESKIQIFKELLSNDSIHLKNWEKFGFLGPVKKCLQKLQFTTPTQIQKEALLPALKGKDVMASAQTGSGKTFVYLLPIINHLSSLKLEELIQNEGCFSLILVPTKELVIQVTNHIKIFAQFMPIKICQVLGGMCLEKQIRLMNKIPNIIVATPGRLWDLINRDQKYSDIIQNVKKLVFDEADKMLEDKRFKELTSIIDIIYQKEQTLKKSTDIQTFLLSATLLGEDETKNKDKHLEFLGKIKLNHSLTKINLSSKSDIYKNLQHFKIECVPEKKDLLLYYLLLTEKGRKIVFVNTIDSVRRLGPLLSVLELAPVKLHADMKQRLRLKMIDKFKKLENGILIATDVAARGIDICDVEMVIHYHFPRDLELFVHRSGRTARAQKTGKSVAFVSPEDKFKFKKVESALSKSVKINTMKIDGLYTKKITELIDLASKIESFEHKIKKQQAEKTWLKTNSEIVDAEEDTEEDSDLEEINDSKRIIKEQKERLSKLIETTKKEYESLKGSNKIIKEVFNKN